VSIKLHRLVERLAIAAMLTGIIGMFQPLIFDFFGWGFLLLLFGTIAFTVIANIGPRDTEKSTTTVFGAESG